MRLLRFNVSKDDPPRHTIGVRRNYHGHPHGLCIIRGRRCWLWIWRLVP